MSDNIESVKAVKNDIDERLLKMRTSTTSSIKNDKLIYADDVLKYAVLAGEIRNPYMEVISAYFVREARAVDAVEVVRCGKCEYWEKRFVNSKGFVICPASGMNITADDFCSYGERRDDDE